MEVPKRREEKNKPMQKDRNEKYTISAKIKEIKRHSLTKIEIHLKPEFLLCIFATPMYVFQVRHPETLTFISKGLSRVLYTGHGGVCQEYKDRSLQFEPRH
jgi:hypothetical protein